MANGEVEKAICRLRSSIDLDTSIFETHYNLGVALIEVKEYQEAQQSLENAIKLKPDFADSYYSLAMAFEGQADNIINGVDVDKKADTDTVTDDDTDSDTVSEQDKSSKTLSEQEKVKIVELYNSAVENYNKYLVKKPDAEDKDKVTEQISYLNTQIQQYNSVKNTSMDNIENVSASTAEESAE